MGFLRLALVVLAAAATLANAQDVEIVAATCSEARNCGECLQSGCAWQPGADGTDTNCFADCMINEVEAFMRRCYIGNAKTCPKSEAVCAELTSCEDCTAKGCRFTEGVCQPECNFGVEGELLGACSRSVAECAISPRAAEIEVPVIETGVCGQYSGDCSTCVAEGCVFVQGNGGKCKSECAFEDENCIADAGCPNSILRDTRTEVLPELPTVEIPGAETVAGEAETETETSADVPTEHAASLAIESAADDSASTSDGPFALLVHLCAALVALHFFAA